ncbi:P2Y purinoceptor 14-like [Girardinichthys multiradiatus]|uniref:P2Y purinoceptor 14-like n=1 Tax=Girardinichthys multiradiatus TaxID=208333 RepID=UPI001FAB689B|nr:P2Y purinoceptor 14-like [Girardinichthys multiradiatus]XP_047248191.1 P2Y purinoceptor 14-like [Girardinichthys multiradiatus]XP_047248192.1 P2Y purinoceptor 14-like [Girardinichthys multiradiatus]
MNTSNSTSCEPVHQPANIFFISIYSVIFLVGLVLNGFTLRVYFCVAQRQASSSVTIYLKNLAASDFLISLCLPLRIINFSTKSTLIRQVYCNFGASAFYLNMYASILFMGYIAANRYMKIVHPLGNHFFQTARAAYITSIFTWGFLLAMTSTYVILSLLTQNDQGDLPGMVSCDVLHSKQLSLLYKIIHTCSAAIFLLVLIALILFYYNTSRKLSLAQKNQPTSNNSKKLAKSQRNMLVLVTVFCICFVPYHLVRLPYAFKKNLFCSWNWWFFYLKELSVLVSVLNVCLDPLIYFIFCKAFRAQMSMRRVFNATESPTQVENLDRRSSDGRLNSLRNLRKSSIISLTKQTRVL